MVNVAGDFVNAPLLFLFSIIISPIPHLPSATHITHFSLVVFILRLFPQSFCPRQIKISFRNIHLHRTLIKKIRSAYNKTDLNSTIEYHIFFDTTCTDNGAGDFKLKNIFYEPVFIHSIVCARHDDGC